MDKRWTDITKLAKEAERESANYNAAKQFDLMTLADIERYIRIAYEHGYIAGRQAVNS